MKSPSFKEQKYTGEPSVAQLKRHGMKLRVQMHPPLLVIRQAYLVHLSVVHVALISRDRTRAMSRAFVAHATKVFSMQFRARL